MSKESANRRIATQVAVSVLSILGGCAHEYDYRPAERDLVPVQGVAGARYPIPPERPEGELRVASFGMQELSPSTGGPALPALHLRMIVANNGDTTPWTVDTRQTLIEIAGEGSSPAVYLNADVGGLPVLTIARGEQRVIDFFFPLPGGMQSTGAVLRFDVKWQINTGARPIAGRTSFDRFEPPNRETRVALAVGWGPFWWYDPFYPRVGVFVHPGPFFVVPRHPHRVYVVPRGRRR